MAKVSVITATTGNPLLAGCLRSVAQQTHKDVQHIVVVDGPEHWNKVDPIFSQEQFPNGTNQFCIQLPYSVGKDRWNGHRIYGATTYLADGDFIMYLDEDNNIEPTHIEDCLKVIEAGNQWAMSFRNIIDKEGTFICQDNCENLGKWKSVLNDYFVDVNCFFLPKLLAIQVSPLWYRKAREPGVMEVDRILTQVLREIAPKFDTTYNYTVNYTVGNTGISVKDSFFVRGNEHMKQVHGGKYPWQK